MNKDLNITINNRDNTTTTTNNNNNKETEAKICVKLSKLLKQNTISNGVRRFRKNILALCIYYIYRFMTT